MNRKERRKAAREKKRRAPAPTRNVESLLDQASALQAQGALGEAEAACRRVLAAEPDNAEALNILGIVHARAGNPQSALELMERSAALVPDNPGYLNNQANVLTSLGRRGDAVAAYRRSLELRPDDPQTLNNMGSALKAMGRAEEALDVYDKALALRPGYFEAWSNKGNALFDLGQVDDAEAAHRRALALNPDYAIARNNLGLALTRLGRFEDAVGEYQRALAIDPDYADALSNMGEALRARGDAAAAVAYYKKSLQTGPFRLSVFDNFLLCLNYLDDIPDAVVLDAHAQFGAKLQGLAAQDHGNERDPGRRLRVGYLSPDFRKHSVAYFIEPVLEAHDRDKVEVFCYASVGEGDAVTERLRALSDHWRDVTFMDDDQAAETIRADRVDVLVELGGHTMASRLAVLARKPAPVQATYIGYPNTSGLPQVDWRITDGISDPEGEAESRHTERLARLPSGFLCYRPPDDAPEPEASERDAVVFGSFNNLSKVTPAVAAAWAAILNAVPGARLFLKAKPLGDPGTRKRIADRFAEHGVPEDRLEMVGWIMDGSHLAAYDRIDVGLDTFPYNGTTTTCEALWMGVPVVTLEGRTHAGRVGKSLLSRVGLDDLAAPDVNAYVAKAAELANDRARRGELKTNLRDKMAPLTDAKRLAGELEDAYRVMWREWLAV